jgi:hypothetical protein
MGLASRVTELQGGQNQFYPGAAFYPGSAPANNRDGSGVLAAVRARLSATVAANGLSRLYPAPRLEQVAQAAARADYASIAAKWRLPSLELALDLASLALYDVVLLCDDSGSMAMAEGGSRIDDLKFVVSQAAEIATRFDDDGIAVRFLNADLSADGVRTEAEASQLVSRVTFTGPTPLGSMLQRKVLEPMLFAKAAVQVAKPLLVIIVTDGEPDSKEEVLLAIRGCKNRMGSTPLGPNIAAYVPARTTPFSPA